MPPKASLLFLSNSFSPHQTPARRLVQENVTERKQSRGMSNRRKRGATRISDDELKELVLKIQALLPAESSSRSTTRVPASKILKETCNYIKKLHKEVDDLSTRLTYVMDSMDSNSVDVETLRSLLQRHGLS